MSENSVIALTTGSGANLCIIIGKLLDDDLMHGSNQNLRTENLVKHAEFFFLKVGYSGFDVTSKLI
jgi:hypothetical protein